MDASAPPARGDEPRRPLMERLARYNKYLLLFPLVFLLVTFFLMPILTLLRTSFYQSRGASGFGIGGAEGGGFYVEGTWTLDNYIRFFTDDYFLSVTMFTLGFGLMVTVITMLLAYPMAYYIYRAPPRLKTVLILIVILPKLSNMLVLVYGLQMILANNGPINELMLTLGMIDEPVKLVYTLFSATVSKVLLIIPYTILVITATLHTLDPSLRDAARGLGAGPIRTFWLVTFPISLPGTLIALLITIVWALGAFVSPALLGNPETQTLAVEVPKQTFENVNWAMGATISFVILGIMTAVVFAYNWLIGTKMKWQG
jgi:ABC-type spermidine/putrescine transport system permease subunit I